MRPALLLACLVCAPALFAQRAPDSLLRRPDLQRLVDLQVERDGPALREALADRDATVRARAAFALASVQDSASAPVLVALLRDPVAAVRADAAFALGQSADTTRQDALLGALRAEGDPEVQRRLLEALGKTGGASSLGALAALNLPDGLDADRALALARYGLRNVYAPAAVRHLAEALTASDARVRRNAAYFFGRVSRPAAWADAAPRVRAALDAYAPADEAAMHLLLGLGRLSDASDTPRLRRWLTAATDARLRINAARALGPRFADPDVRTALVAALSDLAPLVGVAAAEALSGAPTLPAETVDALTAWVRAHPAAWQVAAALGPVLVRSGAEPAVAAWTARQPTPARQARGLAALGAGTRAGVRDTLFALARSPQATVAAGALGALAARWSREKGALDAAMRTRYFTVFTLGVRRGDVATISEAADVLADSLFRPLGGAGVLAAAYAPLQAPLDVDAMTALLGALGSTRNTAYAPLLRTAAASSDPSVARAGAGALRRLAGERVAVPANAAPQKRVDWAELARTGAHPRLRVETNKGAFVLELDAEQAPLTTQTLLRLAAARRFDGVPFHRVVANFVVQGGDVERGDGNGGPGFAIRSEFTRVPYERGVAGMASSGKDTEGSQWFVTHSMQPHLDGRYTAFGRVVSGLDVIDRLLVGDVARRVRLTR